MAFADDEIGVGLLLTEAAAPSRLAFLFYKQLEEEAADDALLSQAIKNLVFLAPHIYSADLAAGRVPKLESPAADTAVSGHGEQHGSHTAIGNTVQEETPAGKRGPSNNGAATFHQGDDEDDVEFDAEADFGEAAEGGAMDGSEGGALTLHGLVRRMARLADSRAWQHGAARLAALRFTAALASRLGAPAISPYLPTMLVPLYRITEGGGAPNTDKVRALADEVVAHLRSVAGTDAFLAGYNRARQHVMGLRKERKRQKTVQALLDPEAAAQARMRKQERRATGRKRRMEEVRRVRSSGVAVKNKRPRGKHALQ